ncbi:hypothetical protein PR048_031698 [Dryococelus australis]|uniref:Uncharacterized protein n=1 Tax=Dryococelus australis TaxID=614101 RepID=A0ABQ9G610_9NEOP|nr:hypothetical protein PR048_031698 [Dryococelus australis]
MGPQQKAMADSFPIPQATCCISNDLAVDDTENPPPYVKYSPLPGEGLISCVDAILRLDDRARANPGVNLDSTVMCILEPQMFVHWLLAHTVASVTTHWQYGTRYLFPCKSANDSESSRTGSCNQSASDYDLIKGTAKPLKFCSIAYSARLDCSPPTKVNSVSNPLPGHSGFSHVGIVPDDAAGRRVFSGISRFSRPFIPSLLHSHLISHSSALKTSLLRAAPFSQLNLFCDLVIFVQAVPSFDSDVICEEQSSIFEAASSPKQRKLTASRDTTDKKKKKTSRFAFRGNDVCCLFHARAFVILGTPTLLGWAAVAERLACLPPTKANRVQYPAGSLPDFRMWESCWTMPLVGGFSRGSPSHLNLFTHTAHPDSEACSITNFFERVLILAYERERRKQETSCYDVIEAALSSVAIASSQHFRVVTFVLRGNLGTSARKSESSWKSHNRKSLNTDFWDEDMGRVERVAKFLSPETVFCDASHDLPNFRFSPPEMRMGSGCESAEPKMEFLRRNGKGVALLKHFLELRTPPGAEDDSPPVSVDHSSSLLDTLAPGLAQWVVVPPGAEDDSPPVSVDHSSSLLDTLAPGLAQWVEVLVGCYPPDAEMDP